MKDKTLDDEINKFLQDDNAQNKAVSALIDVKDRVQGSLGSDIELKSDLSDKDICLHTAVDMLNNILTMTEAEFMTKPVLSRLTEIKERKLVSKNRQSRKEIVDVARNPDRSTINASENSGIMKKWFAPRK